MPLGFIVPNHALRRTAYGVAASTPGVRIAGCAVHRVATLPTHAEVDYTDAAARPGQPAPVHRWWWRPTAAFLPRAASWALAPR